MMNWAYPFMPEYKVIADYYGHRRAERSGRPLIAHIDEGCQLLMQWDRPLIEAQAFCLHPLAQAHESIVCKSDAIPLAREYAKVANKYLCRHDTDLITEKGDPTVLQVFLGDMSPGVAWMLLADKVQNQQDFRKYHWFTHNRAHQLDKYFELWITTLRQYYI